MKTDVCPDRELLSSHRLGKVQGDQAERLERHVAACAACQGVMRDLQHDIGSTEYIGVPSKRPPQDETETLPPETRPAQSGAERERTGADLAELSTCLYCRSGDDGSIAPYMNTFEDPEIDETFEIGQTVADRYRLVNKLGKGAMGRVFLAQDLRLDRDVAIKVVSHRRHPNLDVEAILEREAKLGANLNHKGIAAVYDFGFVHHKAYTVFEFVEGETLRELILRREKLPIAEVIPVLFDLAAALDFAHIKGVIHRDLKPENICITRQGEFKILDLGLARDIGRDIETGTYSGTPAYSSPEQAQCKLTDGKSDQYALGLVVFELLSGRRAFADSDNLRLLRRQVAEPPPPPGDFVAELPEFAERALLRALNKDPDDRFPTCQEFAREFGGSMMASSQRHVVTTASEHRHCFYLAHVAEESLLAKRIADGLRSKNHSSWYYGRDAIPGVPFSRQSDEAIQRSQAMILLVSRPAMRSSDLARELEHAHRIGLPILPWLIDLSRDEFEKLAPFWCRMVGASPALELRRTDPPDTMLRRITAAADALGIAPDIKDSDRPTETLPRCSGQIWAADANQIDIEDLDLVLFRNDTIDQFLEGKHRHFIAATKGFGKTLMLTRKRQLLTELGTRQNQTITMVPEGRPYLDFMSEMRSLSDRYEKPLSDLSNTKRLWSAAIRISAISHHPAVIDESEASELDSFPDRLKRWLRGAKIEPTLVFKELTSLRVSELNRLIDETENFLDQKMRQIHAGTYFFVDKVDQAIRHLSRDAWIAVQAGLIEAAWEVMNANSHLKVFASIRQEAFANYQSDVKSNLFAATTNLNYTDEELHSLLDQLVRCYEGCPTFTDFVGLNVLRHGRRAVPEDSFNYVRRHTCGRPRDLVAMASEISSKRASLNEKRLRETVRHVGSTVIVSNIFDEVSVFLNCLNDRDARMQFLSLIPGNILDKAEAIAVCERFNGLEQGSLEHFGEDSSEIYHPFRDLYFAGLLGVIQRDPELGITVQRFRQAHDSLAHGATDLPESSVFLIHPALDTFIRSQRTRMPFLQYQHVAVGEALVWDSYSPALVQIEKHLQKIDDDRFVDLTHQVVKRVQAMLNAGNHPFARVEIEGSNEWKTLCQQESKAGYQDTLFWLGELLEEL